uniref:C2H2-type domain-containing protein n=1 Tax=Anopheles stephensi TaxID=30069 RepID=A0A182Y2A6_ANOST
MDVDTFRTQTADPLSEASSAECSTQGTKEASKAVNRKRNVRETRPNGSQRSDPSYSCDECDLKLSSKIQKKKCLVCNKQFRTDKIKDHVVKEHPKIFEKLLQESTELRCAHCQELYATEEQLNEHVARGEQVELAAPEAQPYYNCTKRYKCCNCEEKFVDKLELAKHQRLHRTVECPLCNQTLRSDKIKQHIASRHDGSSTELLKCTECRKLFENASQLSEHRSNTHKKRVCPVCKKTANYAHIRRHLKSFNSVELSDDSDAFSDSLAEVGKVRRTKSRAVR